MKLTCSYLPFTTTARVPAARSTATRASCGRDGRVDVRATHVGALVRAGQQFDIDDGREQRLGGLLLDPQHGGGARAVADHDEPGAPVCLPAEKVLAQPVRLRREGKVAHRDAPVSARHDVGPRLQAWARHRGRPTASVAVSARKPSRNVVSGRTSSGAMLARLTRGPNRLISHACWSLRGDSNRTRPTPAASTAASMMSGWGCRNCRRSRPCRSPGPR